MFRTSNATPAILGSNVMKPLIIPSVLAAWTASSERSSGVNEPLPAFVGDAIAVTAVVEGDMVEEVEVERCLDNKVVKERYLVVLNVQFYVRTNVNI